MESTPSLACANKCVFCWRHHKNPVGTEWRWQTDEPERLISGFMSNHKDLIKTMRGLPGVLPQRLQEAERIRHCALSLVGEPIIYPHINRFLGLLHENGISSFLVTNAQVCIYFCISSCLIVLYSSLTRWKTLCLSLNSTSAWMLPTRRSCKLSTVPFSKTFGNVFCRAWIF